MKPKFDHKVIRPNGPWVPSNQTDVAKTFEKIRRQQQQIRKERLEKVKKLTWRSNGTVG
jgi:hypothetical protein